MIPPSLIPVFTYGTLQRGQSAHVLLRAATFVGTGSVGGFDLFDCEHFPGIVPADPASPSPVPVRGEVFAVDALTLARLDGYEGSLYRRESVPVALDDGRTVQAFVYVLHGIPKGGAVRIPEGGEFYPSGEWRPGLGAIVRALAKGCDTVPCVQCERLRAPVEFARLHPEPTGYCEECGNDGEPCDTCDGGAE